MDDIRKKISFEDLYIPGLPDTAVQIIAALEDDLCSVTKLEEVIYRDPALTAEVLKIVNAPFYASGKAISSVADTIMFIGLGNLVALVSVVALTHQCMSGNIDKDVIRHLLAVSAAANELAGQVDAAEIRREVAVVAGLLHDIGKLILFESLPEEYELMKVEAIRSGRPFSAVEEEALGFNHCAVGAVLAERWHLPPIYQYALEHHHDKPISADKLSEFDGLCYLIRVSDKMVLDAGIGLGVTTEMDLPRLLEVLGINQSAYDRVAKNVAGMKTLPV
jgi:putative nucleotidyltransferase with HDIG domain